MESSRVPVPYLFSSPSSSSPGNECKVFLSFFGADTRKGIADHLYQRLVNSGTRLLLVIRDEESIPFGVGIKLNLLSGIERSTISIPILSENYASSEWCLMELNKMMSCKKRWGHIILPIFYKVKPAEVRHQKGKFGEAFQSLRDKLIERRRFDSGDWKEWEEALVDVSSLRGWESEKFEEGYEGKLVNDIVETVLKELSKYFRPVVPENLVGIDHHLEEIMRVLDTSFLGTRVIGVYGMPGIGKTTLAKLAYTKLCSEFRYHSFIADIRESVEGKAKGIESLQSQLIHDLLERKIEVHNVDEGTNILRYGLKEKKVLILLDDVTDEKQLIVLFGEYKWYSSGSRIIITTQNRNVLNERSFVYELNELSSYQSLLLFSQYAFSYDFPPHEFKDISRQVVAAIGGLPLALQVIGLLLRGENDLEVWKEMVKKLMKVPVDEVKPKLKLSYNKLNYETQQIFLDIACFFTGIDRNIPFYMWQSCDFYPAFAIKVLVNHALIRIGDNNEIQMHDQLRALGREIVLEENYGEPKNRSRLWDYEAALEVLKGKEGAAKTQAIYLEEIRSGQVTTYMGDQLENLPNLRFLDVSDVNFAGDFQNSLSKLRWLRWKSHPLTVEVLNFHLKELIILDLAGSHISEHWQGWYWITRMANQLKVLNLMNCFLLESTPDLSAFESLEILNLTKCSNLMQIGSSIEGLKNLACLNVGSCPKLKVLPPEVSNLEGLKVLIIDNTGIEVIPELGYLKKLEVLSARGCKNLVHFPQIQSLNRTQQTTQSLELDLSLVTQTSESLTKLDLSGTSLQALPEFVQFMWHLRELNVRETLIDKLPASITRLKKLKVLIASNCRRLEGEIPEYFGDLSSLEIFRIDGTNISSLPKSIFNLSSLQLLDLNRCEKLHSLPLPPYGLTSLLLTCESGALYQLSHLTDLRELTLRGCRSLEIIRSLPSGLSKLHVSECDKLKILPNMSRLKYLSILEVLACFELMEIKGLEALKSLRILNVSGCRRLSKLDGLGCLESLIHLSVGWCDGLDVPPSQEVDNLAEIRGLDKLTHLDVSGRKSIKTLELSNLEHLKTLYARNCANLVEIRGLDISKSLAQLDLYGCRSLTRLPDLSCFNTLYELNIHGCEKLCDIERLENFSFCRCLCIKGCTSLVKLPDLSNFKVLWYLEVIDCPEILEIPGLGDSMSLIHIDLSGCKSVETLPDLLSCKKLEYMALRDCMKLIELQGLEDLKELKELDISGCKLLKTVPKPPRACILKNYENGSSSRLLPDCGINFW